jgi:hypothetical protein
MGWVEPLVTYPATLGALTRKLSLKDRIPHIRLTPYPPLPLQNSI